MTRLAPRDEAELADAIRAANASGAPLKLTGAGSKTQLGRPATGEELSLAALEGVTLYEPEELVISARAGTPLAKIEALLEAHGQHLAFEPMDYGPLLGLASGEGSIGGLVAVGGGGPRRIKAGALRDHLLGFRCVTGRGEIVKSGGRVMKNVTGYDLSKLVAGSHGTLAALTEVTFKALPKPETEQTLLLTGLCEEASLAALRAASGSPYEPSGLALLPRLAAPLRLAVNAAAIRLEGPAISVARRLDDLRALLAERGGAFETLPQAESAALWRALRDAAPVAARAWAGLARFGRAHRRSCSGRRAARGRDALARAFLRLGGRSGLAVFRARAGRSCRVVANDGRRDSAATPRSFARAPRFARRSMCSSRNRRRWRR